MRTSRSASGFTRRFPSPRWTAVWKRRCAAARYGTRSRTSCVRAEGFLFAEPRSALDPISTAKIEELIQELAEDYTIAIVTHNMQQAARVSDKTAFMYLGELSEFGETDKIFTSPSDRRTQDYITGRFG